MASIGAVQIKVDSQTLVSQAEEVRRLGRDMKNHFQEIAATMNRTKGYWIGEAGEAHRKSYEKQKDNVNKMMARLMEHPDDLTAIAGNYTKGEKANISTAKALPSDVLG